MKGTKRDRRKKGRVNRSLPIFTVDTEEEVRDLFILAGRQSYTPGVYIMEGFFDTNQRDPAAVDAALDRAADRLRVGYARMNARRGTS